MKSPALQQGLKVRRQADYQSMSRAAAEWFGAELSSEPGLLLCASAGGTQTGFYQELAARHLKKPRLFSKLRVLQIDEWGGLPAGHPASCRTDLLDKLIDPLNIGAGRFKGFRSDRSGVRECARIKRWLGKHGPIDVCLLGLGLNGHIAMNEPSNFLIPDPHVSHLTKSSLKHGMLKSLSRKPQFGLTLGLGDILKSRKIILLVSGSAKRQILKRMLKPQVSNKIPASFLWLHSDVTIFCDAEALP